MNDELDARLRALDAEQARPPVSWATTRQRPAVAGDLRSHRRPVASVEVLLGELIAALAQLHRTPPDREQGTA